MKFETFDARMRLFETAHDHCVLPGLYIVVRLDGKNFTRLTKETWPFQVPFDPGFRDLMVDTVEHLMQCGVNVIYAYAQSDEISLLLRRDDDSFGRKTRKLISILAGEASAKFSLGLGGVAVFDARVSQLPSPDHVVDYFRWRHEDAHRNALNAHCYWGLRGGGESPSAAAQMLRGLSTAEKNELLFRQGINFNDLPSWQKRGMALFWHNGPTSNEDGPGATREPGPTEPVRAPRRRLERNLELPLGEAYGAYVRGFVV
ncbi:tRNA(His) guanylyltransferase Thg1 family protein [Lysobacter enzymogenes]|uniref:tRNA(His) guanylyltransferase Thg1 family protein n=1 Tax=Lysobacter enzymogenes TaxID=69 RepID=UPI003749B985